MHRLIHKIATAILPIFADLGIAMRGACRAAARTFALLLFVSLSAMGQEKAPPHGLTGFTSQATDRRGTEPTQTIIYRPFYLPSACDLGPGLPASGASEARATLLDRRGPQLPPVFNMSAFSAMGFSKGNWPVVVDYFLEQDSLLIFVVAPEGSEPIIYRVDGKKGHWQGRLTLPQDLGDQPRVAHYVIRSLEENVGLVRSSHVHIHGIAAGPQAVGSIGIDQVSFGPAKIRPARGEKAHYTFHSISDFKNVEVEFVRLANSGNGQIVAGRVGGKPMGSISRNAQKDGDWDGKSDGGGKAAKNYRPEVQQWLRGSQGLHLVAVRAWWGVRDGGDWVTALSDEYVAVE